LNELRTSDGQSIKPQLEMIRGNELVPSVPSPAAGYRLRQATIDDMQSYSRTLATAFEDAVPFGDLMKRTLPDGFFVVEHIPTSTVVAASTAAVYVKLKHPNGHSLQWVVAHSNHRGTGAGQATVAAATQVLADTAPTYSYLETDDFRLPAINIYLKLGWKPLLFEDGQIQRWARVFKMLKRDFDETDFPTTTPN